MILICCWVNPHIRDAFVNSISLVEDGQRRKVLSYMKPGCGEREVLPLLPQHSNIEPKAPICQFKGRIYSGIRSRVFRDDVNRWSEIVYAYEKQLSVKLDTLKIERVDATCRCIPPCKRSHELRSFRQYHVPFF